MNNMKFHEWWRDRAIPKTRHGARSALQRLGILQPTAQSLNEIFAAKLHEQQGFSEYTHYSLVRLQVDGNVEGLGCMCYDFCSEDVECISAWNYFRR